MKNGPSPREYTLEFELLAGSYGRIPASPSLVHCLTIGTRRQSHVIGIFVAAFYLERRNTNLDDFRNLFQSEKVTGRKKIAGVAQGLQLSVHQHFVGQPAGLSALSPVRAASSPGFR